MEAEDFEESFHQRKLCIRHLFSLSGPLVGLELGGEGAKSKVSFP